MLFLKRLPPVFDVRRRSPRDGLHFLSQDGVHPNEAILQYSFNTTTFCAHWSGASGREDETEGVHALKLMVYVVEVTLRWSRDFHAKRSDPLLKITQQWHLIIPLFKEKKRRRTTPIEIFRLL